MISAVQVLRPSWFCCLMLMLGAGCGGQSGLTPPEYDPETGAELALAQYDADSDGKISSSELEAAPGLQAALPQYDADGDGSVSKTEVADRIRVFQGRGVALTKLQCVVTYKGRPLRDATVRLIPEAYLGEAIKPASGVTNQRGAAMLTVADEDLPEEQRGIRGVHYGTYRVEITHPEVELPAKYNSASTLGHESKVGERVVEFKLK